jgi:RND family efflux transporter MFP subunit
MKFYFSSRVIFPLFFSTASVLFSCNSKIKPIHEDSTYLVTQPILIDTVYLNEYVADIHSLQNVEIRARVKGYLEGIHVDEGQTVKAGQILFTISSVRYKEELIKARATLKSAIAASKGVELRLKNVEQLVAKNIISKTELEMERAKLEAAKADVEIAKSNEFTAELNLSFTEIKAPFDGVINRIPYKAGSLISEETLLTNISNNEEVFAYFNVSEREYLDYKSLHPTQNKSEVSLVLANNQLFPLKGTIETMEGEFDKSTGNIAFRARFRNPKGILKNGSSGKIQIKNVLHKVMVVPQKSTFEIQDKIYVYVVNENNIAQMKNITFKLRLQYLYIVDSGLSLEDRFVYEGIQHIKEGDEILPEPVSLKEMLLKEAS